MKKKFYPTGELLSETTYSKKDSSKDGTYMEYYKNGQLKQRINFENNVQIDSAFLYYDSGELKFKQLIKKDTVYATYYYINGNVSILKKFLNKENPIEVGWAKGFDSSGVFTDSIEYFNIASNAVINQRIHYNEKGKILLDSSNFYRMKVSKIKGVDKHQLKVNYIPSVKDATVLMIINKNINDDFSNLKGLKLDTLFLENNILISNALNKPYQNLKGFFYEYKADVKNKVGKDSVRMSIYEKKTYFDEHIKVTDTIDW